MAKHNVHLALNISKIKYTEINEKKGYNWTLFSKQTFRFAALYNTCLFKIPF